MRSRRHTETQKDAYSVRALDPGLNSGASRTLVTSSAFIVVQSFQAITPKSPKRK